MISIVMPFMHGVLHLALDFVGVVVAIVFMPVIIIFLPIIVLSIVVSVRNARKGVGNNNYNAQQEQQWRRCQEEVNSNFMNINNLL